MFTIKWINPRGDEYLYSARSIVFVPASPSLRARVEFFALGSGEQKEDVHSSIDCGRIFVMNAHGRTVSDYFLGDPEHEAVGQKAA